MMSNKIIEEFEKECQKTRDGKNLCDKCGNPKVMYYAPYCYHCDKPKVEIKPTRFLNVIQAIDYIKIVLKKEDVAKRIYEYLCNAGIIEHNDMITWFYLEDDEINDDIRFFMDTFEITMDNPVILEISW